MSYMEFDSSFVYGNKKERDSNVHENFLETI